MFTLLIRVGFRTTKPLNIITKVDYCAFSGGIIATLFKGKVKSMTEGFIIVEVTGKGRLGNSGMPKVFW